MKLLNIIIAAILLLTSTLNAQIKNSKTEIVKVYGNCGMCKTKIEKAGTQKNISKTEWNEETTMATITYDAKKATADAILKKISLVGYDSDSFLAPDAVYNKLHGCCKYERKTKLTTVTVTNTVTIDDNVKQTYNPTATKPTEANPIEIKQEINQTQAIYDIYFALKDALVKTDTKIATEKATTLLATLKAINMEKLDMATFAVYSKIYKSLNDETKNLIVGKTIEEQREAFSNLSNYIIKLIKTTKANNTVYIQHCPMANNGEGADWLSKEKIIQNPYYGSMMLGCGKVIATIQ